MQLHKLPQGFIVTSDEPINKGDYYFTDGEVFMRMTQNGAISSYAIKVTYQEPNIILSSLSEAEQNVIGYWDIEAFARSYLKECQDKLYGTGTQTTHPMYRNSLDVLNGVVKGAHKMNELLSDRMFTKQDMGKAYTEGWQDRVFSSGYQKDVDEYLQSLTPQSWKIEAIEEDGKIKVLKLI